MAQFISVTLHNWRKALRPFPWAGTKGISVHQKSRRKLLAAAVAIGMTALAGCGSAGAQAGGNADTSMEEMSERTLTYSDLSPSTSDPGKAVQRWVENLDELTGGKLVVEPYFSSSLLTSDDALSGTTNGVSDITYTVVTYQPQELSVTNWFNNAGSSPVDVYPHNQLQMTGAINEVFSSAAATAEFEKHNLKFLFTASPAGKYDLLCKEPLTSQSDLHGLRVRAPGPAWAAEAEALGMTVVNIAQGEAYEGLQRGVIDCQIGMPQMYETYGLSEIAKEYYPAAFSANMGAVFIMNLDTWNEMPLAAQQTLHDSVESYAFDRLQENINAQKVFFDKAEQNGITTHDVTEMNATLAEFQEARSADWVGQAPDAIQDSEKEASAFMEIMSSWGDVVMQDVPEQGSDDARTWTLEDFPGWEAKLHEHFDSVRPE
ncbi:C4-dicarboxylate TRAP transporter substrate-binding protein [Arthrobacter sp. NPDC089319]|uniref:C4-dicarboxylate TRAP transporter substrate-binding protein n=1 Tax=Arthrobacter sp. NPDC089319 TaxID=3155915 RepID=UPI003421AE83